MTKQRINLGMKRACMALLFYQSAPHGTPWGRRVVWGSPEKPWRSERAMVLPLVKMLSPIGNPLSCDLCENETRRKTAQQAQRAGSWKDRQTYLRSNPALMIDLAALHHAGICLWERSRAQVFPSVLAHHFHKARRDNTPPAPASFAQSAWRVSASLQDAGGMQELARSVPFLRSQSSSIEGSRWDRLLVVFFWRRLLNR